MNVPKIMIGGLLAFCLSGCASSAVLENNGADTQTPRFSESVNAFADGKYARMAESLSPELKAELTEERFDTMLENLSRFGRIYSVSYVTSVRQSGTFAELWKITLRKSDRNGNDVLTEKILRIVGGNTGDANVVIGLMLQ